MKRREFIKQVVQTTTVASAMALSAKRVLGANERVVVGDCLANGQKTTLTLLKPTVIHPLPVA